MIHKEIKLRPGFGLHAKSAAEFIQRASNYKSSIWVEKDEKKANAKSLLGLLALGLAADTSLRIIADGEDEERAVAELGEFMLMNL
ncbi:MAG: HPr family phosphocarrier protein [Clostridiales bacterium]|jgi:phosphocarrier protein|nr:HPr family phosphocarrier protein [Clostridiales bacterium]